MKVNEIIKKRRKELGLTLKQVAEKLGVSESLISRYESNDVKNMGIDKIIPLAKVLDTTPAFLMGWETKKEKEKEKENINLETVNTDYIMIPLYESISAGYGASNSEFIEMIPVFGLKKNGTTYFAVKVEGDSMEPKIPNGSTIIIKKDIQIESGEIGAFNLNDENFVKQKKVVKDKLILHSFNLAYYDKLVNEYDDFKEYGKVVKVMIDL
jgi:lexA repressor